MNPAPSTGTTNSRIPTEIVAAIAAAVHTTLGKGYRVVSIKPHDSNWEKFGRQAVFFSHRIRR